MKYRAGYWAACCIGMLNAGLAVANGASAHWLLFAVNTVCVPVAANSARIFRKHMPLTTPNHPLATKHDQCLAEIDRLERELADDGVLFLKSDDEFDREIAKILPRPKPVTTAPRLGVIAPIPVAKLKKLRGLCPVSGAPYQSCVCDARWASIRQCPARR